jgi:hypothetical protein
LQVFRREEEERLLAFENRTADCASELVHLERWFVGVVPEVVSGVEHRVAEIVPCLAVKLTGSGARG